MKVLNKLDELWANSDSIDTLKLLRLKLSLEEKLGTLRTLDGEILDLTNEDDLGDEIEQTDAYKESIYDAMVTMEKFCTTVHAAATPPAPPLPRNTYTAPPMTPPPIESS